MSEIVLSICECGRNDNYGLDFKRRFVQSANFLAWSARRAGVFDKLEVVFIDWNSDVPLASELLLSEDAAKIVRFIEVPSEIARPLNYGNTSFHTCRSFNTAFRRARGKYIAMMPGDILLTQYALRALFGLLEKTISAPFDPEHSLMAVPRKNIAHYADDGWFFRTPEEMEALLLDGDFYFQRDCFSKGLNCGFGMFLLPRELLWTLHGLNEDIGGWGASDVEFGLLCAEKQVKLRNLSGLGIFSYDFEVNRKMVCEKNARCVETVRRKSMNPETWGLSERELRETRAKTGMMSSSAPKTADNVWLELVSRLRFLPLSACPYISSLALSAGLFVMMKKNRKVLCRKLSEPSSAAVLSLAEPFLDLTFFDDAYDHELRFGAISQILAKTMHHGHVHFQTMEPDSTDGFDLIVSTEKIPGKTGLEIPEKNLFLYGDLPENLQLLDIRPLNGNGFTEIRFPGRWLKLWNILGRLGIFRWIPVLNQLQRKFH